MHDVRAFDCRVTRWHPSSEASKPSTGEDSAMSRRLALRNTVGDVEEDDVAELLEAGEEAQACRRS
jgi:hypothetical protein